MSEHVPSHDAALDDGAVFAEDAGWLVVDHFGDEAAEYRAAREGAALFDLSHRGKVEVTGPEAGAFLHNLVTNDVKNLPYSHGCEAFLCSAQARVLARALIYHLKVFDDHLFASGHESFWLDVDPGLGEKVAKHLDRHLISERAEVFDRTRSHAHLHLAGPGAPALMAQGDIKDLPEMQLMQLGWGGDTAQVRRHDRLGTPGYDIVCPTEMAASTWRLYVGRGARPAGLRAYEVLRVEAGTPVYGKDLDETNLAPEVNRTARAISYAKGCYLGQEPIVRIRDLGHVNRLLVGVKIAGGLPVPRGARLLHGGAEAGRVTSCVVSPALGTIALAYVRRAHASPGGVLDVEAEGTPKAEVVALPFYGAGAR